MRKIVALLAPVAMLLSLQAWPVTESGAPGVSRAGKCLFPHSKKRAPKWLCDARAEGLAAAAVGSTTHSDAGHSFMEQMAATDARTHLARTLGDTVQEKVAANSKSGAKRDAAKIIELTEATLKGAKVVRSISGPDGTLYVLVGMDAARARQVVDSVSADYLASKTR